MKWTDVRAKEPDQFAKCAKIQDRVGDLQIFSLALSQLSYRVSGCNIRQSSNPSNMFNTIFLQIPQPKILSELSLLVVVSACDLSLAVAAPDHRAGSFLSFSPRLPAKIPRYHANSCQSCPKDYTFVLARNRKEMSLQATESVRRLSQKAEAATVTLFSRAKRSQALSRSLIEAGFAVTLKPGLSFKRKPPILGGRSIKLIVAPF